MTEFEEKMQETYKNTNAELINMLKKDRMLSLYVQIALICCILIMAICFMACSYKTTDRWLEYESQFETITVDSEDGNANYIGESGDITNGND